KWENFYAGADPAVDFTAFSFQAIKHLTTIDGGMLSVSPAQSEEIHSKARKLKWFGIPREAVKEETRWNYDIPEPGFKFHMNNVNATIGLVQLDFVDKIIRRHKENGDWYNKNLQDVEGIKLPYIPPFAEPSY